MNILLEAIANFITEHYLEVDNEKSTRNSTEET